MPRPSPTWAREVLEDQESALFEDVLPFWMRHALDEEQGGYLHYLRQDGSVYESDKGLWVQGRFAWLLCSLVHEYPQHPDAPAWRRAAESGVRFLERHGPAGEGRYWFQVTRAGQPLRLRRYCYSEAFAAIAYAAWWRLSGEEAAADRSLGLLELFRRWVRDPGSVPGCEIPKVQSATRASRSLGPPMILLATAQVLRECLGAAEAEEAAREAVDGILDGFLCPEREALLECVGTDGRVLDHIEGRTLNPGHAMEAAWFLLQEAEHQADRAEELRRAGLDIVDWTWRRGWDPLYGGLLAFTSLDGGPVAELTAEWKYWWPQTEAALACLHAYGASGDASHRERLEQVLGWARAHCHDPQHGEWFGYLSREGQPRTSVKGNLWKGPFHLPRMHLVAARLLRRWS